MKWIGKGKEFSENCGKINERKFVEIYVFSNPEIVSYETGFVGVHPKGNGYCYWLIENDNLKKVQDFGILVGVGIHKDYLFEIERNSLGDLSEKLGVEIYSLKSVLEGILYDKDNLT